MTNDVPRIALEERLNEVGQLVEETLAGLLDGPVVAACPERLLDAMRHGVLGGGKRLRPFLMVECAKVLGAREAQVMPAAAALELVHCYSLIHDDLPAMDNDLVRRGRPTVWSAYDEWTGILAGDALLTLAFEVLAAPEAHPDPAVRSELCLLLAKAAGSTGMVGGQALDLEAEKLGLPKAPEPEHVTLLQAMKTGALIRFACEAGAVIGCAEADQRQALVEYGRHIGVAFQLADDLLDVEGNAEEMGKAVGKDAAAGKATLITLLGIEASKAALQGAEEAAIAALAPLGDKAEVLRQTARFISTRKR